MMPKIEIILEEDKIKIIREDHEKIFSISELVGMKDIGKKVYEPEESFGQWYREKKSRAEEELKRLEYFLDVPTICTKDGFCPDVQKNLAHRYRENLCTLEIISALRGIRDKLPKPETESQSYWD